MVAVLYVYAIFLIGLCVGTAFMGFSAFAITQRTMLLYLSAFALCYAFEQAIVFFNEFLAQNLPFRNDRFSDMEDPLVHIVTGALLCQMLWMAFLTFFDDRRPTMRFVPLALFLILSIATLLLPTNDESLRKWLMYSARQLFFLWDAIYCVIRYGRTASRTLRMRYRSKGPFLIIFVVLVVTIFAEDTVVMLFLDPSTIENSDILAYLYRRNTCESLLVLCIIGFTLQQSVQALQLKREETTLPQTTQKQAHARDILPYFAKKHSLTPREQEILSYVIQGMDNFQISQELQVSICTVKTHTHHLFKKTGTSNREELLAAFWAER